MAILRDVRFPIDNDRFISCRLVYKLGGRNVWTGREESRGYWLSVSVVDMVRGICTVCPADGLKVLLKEVNRASRKAEEEASRVMDDVIEDVVCRVCDKNGIDRAALGARVER